MERIIYAINVFFFLYMFIYAVFYFIMTYLASLSLDDFYVRKKHMSYAMLNNQDNFIPISIIVPAYNEEVTIVDSVNSLLNLDYPEYEIIVVNDGSGDNTSQRVIEHFGLKKVARPIRKQIKCNDEIDIYENQWKNRIILVNKKNGGKADALNMGINVSRFPLFICLDADSMLQEDSLRKIIIPFMESDYTIAVGGNIKVANQTVINKGKIVDIVVPKKWIVLFQMIEYYRVFLTSRVFLNSINANLIISGAFGLFNKRAVINVGGYTSGVIGEDMDLVVKLHAFYTKNKLQYRTSYVPDAICWSQVPESLAVLKTQRKRWHIGMGQSLLAHKFMCLNRAYGTAGMIAYPYFLIFEYITPIIEVLGITTIILSFVFDIINVSFFLAYLGLYIGYSIVVSIVSIFLESYLFGNTLSLRLMLKLVLFSIFESFGFRQLCSLFRLGAFFGNKGGKSQWGTMSRVNMKKTI